MDTMLTDMKAIFAAVDADPDNKALRMAAEYAHVAICGLIDQVRTQKGQIVELLDVGGRAATVGEAKVSEIHTLKALLKERDDELCVEKHTVATLRETVRALKAEKGITVAGATHDEIAALRIKVATMEPIVKLALHQKKIRAEASVRAKERKAKGLATTRTKTEFQQKRGETNEARVIREAALKAKVSVDLESESMAVEAAPMAPIVKKAPPMIACDGCEEPVAKGKGYIDGESFHCDTCHEHYEPDEDEEAAAGAGEE
jgi:hypothetical protein